MNSGHRAYLGLDRSKPVDAEPVLRHLGANKNKAIEVYAQFVNAALAQKSQREYYLAAEGRMLGSEEFLDEVKHRIGDHTGRRERPWDSCELRWHLRKRERNIEDMILNRAEWQHMEFGNSRFRRWRDSNRHILHGEHDKLLRWQYVPVV